MNVAFEKKLTSPELKSLMRAPPVSQSVVLCSLWGQSICSAQRFQDSGPLKFRPSRVCALCRGLYYWGIRFEKSRSKTLLKIFGRGINNRESDMLYPLRPITIKYHKFSLCNLVSAILAISIYASTRPSCILPYRANLSPYLFINTCNLN